MIPRPFVDAVEAGKPEALAILAYFYVALHFCRDIWLIGNSGQFLLTSVATHLNQLGPEWSAWLEKPCQMLRESLEEDKLNTRSSATSIASASPLPTWSHSGLDDP